MGNLVYLWPLTFIVPIIVYGSELVHRIKKAMHQLTQEEVQRKIQWMESALRSPEGAWAAAPMMTRWFDWYPDELARHDEWWAEFSPNMVGNYYIPLSGGEDEIVESSGQRALESINLNYHNIETINEQRMRILEENDRILEKNKRPDRAASYVSAGPGGGYVTPNKGLTDEQATALHYQFPKLGCNCDGCTRRHDEFMCSMVCDYRRARGEYDGCV